MTLFQIIQDERALFQLVEEEDGDITGQEEAFIAMAMELAQAGEKKLQGCGHIITGLEAQAEWLKTEEARLKALRTRYEKTAERIRAMVKYYLENSGKQKITTDKFVFSIVNNAPSVQLLTDDATKLPDEFCNIVTKREISKSAIKDFFKANDTNVWVDAEGRELAQLVQNTRLSIK